MITSIPHAWGQIDFRLDEIQTHAKESRLSHLRNSRAEALLERFGIFTVHRECITSGTCVRLTPAIFTAMEDVVRSTSALKALTSS